MARIPNPETDFTVDVPDIGRFVFARRKMADERKIQVAYARIIEGVEPTPWLQTFGDWQCTLDVLTVTAPPGWDIDEMDPLDDQTYTNVGKVYSALRAKEGSFRRKPGEGSAQAGAGQIENGGVLVSPEVPANP